MPEVSVIIPTYNRANLVKEAVESVLAQTFKDFEIIIVDDGSTDDTRFVIEAIDDNRIRYFYKDNGGVSSARNLGMTASMGQYIAFLDSDDLWPENYLNTMLSYLTQKSEYGAAYCLHRDVCLDGREIDGFGPDRYFSGWLTKRFFAKKIPYFVTSSTLYCKSALEDFFFDEYLKCWEDFDFFLRLSPRTKSLCVPDVSVIRRRTPGSLSSVAKADYCVSVTLSLERFYFHLGGQKIVPAKAAKRKISKMYRRLAKIHYRQEHRKATILSLKKAISYYPFEPTYYTKLLKALFLSKKTDKLPNWQMPKPLPPHITVYQKLDKNSASL